MSLDFKLFTIRTENDEILFQAYVADKEAYRIVTDTTGRFTKKFLRIINGRYSVEYFDNETQTYEKIEIASGDALENLRTYQQKAYLFSSSVVTIENADIRFQFALHFHGADYNMRRGMEPRAQHKVNDFFYSLTQIAKTPTAANNESYRPDTKPENFSVAKAASIKLELYSTVDYMPFQTTLKEVVDDVKSNALRSNPSFEKLYKKVFKLFCSLERFYNLTQLDIAVGNSYKESLERFDDISSMSASLYGREQTHNNLVIQLVKDNYRDGVYDALIVDTFDLSFETIWKYEKSDHLSKFLYYKKGEQVDLTGIQSGEHTFFLQKIRFLRRDFALSDSERDLLMRANCMILDDAREIILPNSSDL